MSIRLDDCIQNAVPGVGVRFDVDRQVGVTGGKPNSIFIDGSIQHKTNNEDLVDTLEKLVRQKLTETAS